MQTNHELLLPPSFSAPLRSRTCANEPRALSDPKTIMQRLAAFCTRASVRSFSGFRPRSFPPLVAIWRSFDLSPAHLSHERRRVLERRVSQPGPLALDDGRREHGHDVRREAGDAAGHPEEHPCRAFVVPAPDHFLHLRAKGHARGLRYVFVVLRRVEEMLHVSVTLQSLEELH